MPGGRARGEGCLPAEHVVARRSIAYLIGASSNTNQLRCLTHPPFMQLPSIHMMFL